MIDSTGFPLQPTRLNVFQSLHSSGISYISVSATEDDKKRVEDFYLSFSDLASFLSGCREYCSLHTAEGLRDTERQQPTDALFLPGTNM